MTFDKLWKEKKLYYLKKRKLWIDFFSRYRLSSVPFLSLLKVYCSICKRSFRYYSKASSIHFCRRDEWERERERLNLQGYRFSSLIPFSPSIPKSPFEPSLFGVVRKWRHALPPWYVVYLPRKWRHLWLNALCSLGFGIHFHKCCFFNIGLQCIFRSCRVNHWCITLPLWLYLGC